MLEINNLSIEVKQRFLIRNLSLVLNKNDKLAVIGEEGNGKSTLLKTIVGCFDYGNVSGTIKTGNDKVGYLPQQFSNSELEMNVKDYLFKDDEDYLNNITEFYSYINSLNISDELLDLNMKSLSGGQRVKIGLLKLLLEQCDILLLDEPTNDLDISTLRWLENFINNCGKPIMYISHDETLLENTANRILHLQQIKKKSDCVYNLESMGYKDYVERRLYLIDRQNQIAKSEKREYDKQQEKLNQLMNSVDYALNNVSRQAPHTAKMLKRKMGSLKSTQDKLDKKELTHTADVEEEINFFFEKVDMPRNKEIVDLHLDYLKINDVILSENIDLYITGKQHVCIVGENGVGKTTLIRIIYQILKERSDLKVGYMPQSYDDILASYKTVMDFIAPSRKKEDITKARVYLGNMKFTPDESAGDIADLSNGTKAKLILMKLVMDKCNVLILDEPTRNVSPLSNPVIRKVLKDFDGTIISVSHDRKYLDEVIDVLYKLDKDGLRKIEKEGI